MSEDFFVDLLYDDVVVERWIVRGMPKNNSASITDWVELETRVNITAGEHKLKLVVDSTDLIPETNESDNAFEWQYEWDQSPIITTPPPRPSNLPDLVPTNSGERDAPLIATSYKGDASDGPLSVDLNTYIKYGIKNQGIASVPEDIWVYLFMDGLLIDRQLIKGLTALDSASRPEWDGLYNATRVSPGTHTLRMVVDATTTSM